MTFLNFFEFAGRLVRVEQATLCGSIIHAEHALSSWRSIKSVEIKVSSPFVGKNVSVGTIKRREDK